MAALAKWNNTADAINVRMRRSLNSSTTPTTSWPSAVILVSSAGQLMVDFPLANQHDGAALAAAMAATRKNIAP